MRENRCFSKNFMNKTVEFLRNTFLARFCEHRSAVCIEVHEHRSAVATTLKRHFAETLVFFLPMGIAFQYVGLVLLTIRLFYGNKGPLKSLLSLPMAIFGLFWMLDIFMAGSFNPLMSWSSISRIWHYTPLFLIPLLSEQYGRQNPNKNFYMEKTFTIMMMMWALIVISQHFFDWKIQGMKVVLAHEEGRAHGLYSHPLSLSYSAILIWPWLHHAWYKNPRSLFAIINILSCFFLIFYSESRTVQIVSMLYSFYFISKISSRNKFFRICSLVLICGFLSLFTFTENKLKSKLELTFSSQGLGKFSDYPDDRVAFWHAHGLMFLEKPFFGHGFGTNEEYRKPYYAKIGLENFIKNYHAHNSFLQILVHGGLFGLLLLACWYMSIYLVLKKSKSNLFEEFRDTSFCFLIASLTQNSFQDGSVRMWMIFSLGWVFMRLGQTLNSPNL